MAYIKRMGSLISAGVVGTPNYTARVSRSHNTSYTANQDGWVYIYSRGGDTTAGHNTSVIVNNVTYPLAYRYADYGGAASSLLLPVKKGDTYKTTGRCQYVTMYFLPQT